MLCEALHKRKLFLDSFGEGLEEFGIWTLIRNFPQEMKGAFWASGSVDASDILHILTLVCDEEGADEKSVWEYVKAFINNSSEEGMYEWFCHSSLVDHKCNKYLSAATCVL